MTQAQRQGDGRFAPGNQLSPGRPLVPKEVREFSHELRACIVKTLKADPSYINEIISSGKTRSNMELIVAQYVVESVKGSIDHFKLLLSRSIGPEPKAADTSDPEHAEVIDLIPKEVVIRVLTEHYDRQRAAANK